MKQIINNPFRIIGVLSSSTEKVLHRVKSKTEKYLSIGKNPKSDLDFSFLPDLERDESVLKIAYSSIERGEDKIRHSLFWFTSQNEFDTIAIDHLKNGDLQKAGDLLAKVVRGKEFSEKNVSNWNNLSTILLLDVDKDRVTEGIAIKANLVQSVFFSAFVALVADETASSDQNKYLNFLLETGCETIHERFGRDTVFILLDALDESGKTIARKILLEKPIHELEQVLNSTKKDRKSSTQKKLDLGENLLSKGRESLYFIELILGEGHMTLRNLSDKVSLEILQCGIDHYGENKTNVTQCKNARLLFLEAEKFACGQLSKDRISENIEGIDEHLEIAPVKKQLDTLIAKLNSVEHVTLTTKKTLDFIYDVMPPLKIIVKKLGHSHQITHNMCIAVTNIAQENLVSSINGLQEKMQRKNSAALHPKNSDSLRLMVEHAMEVNFIIEGLPRELNGQMHFQKNFTSLKSLAGQIYVKTISPKEKVQARIKSLNSSIRNQKNLKEDVKMERIRTELSGLPNKSFFKEELRLQHRILEDLSKWKLFRTVDSRKIEIENQKKIIKEIERKDSQKRRSRKIRLESQLEKATSLYEKSRAVEIKELKGRLDDAKNELEELF